MVDAILNNFHWFVSLQYPKQLSSLNSHLTGRDFDRKIQLLYLTNIIGLHVTRNSHYSIQPFHGSPNKVISICEIYRTISNCKLHKSYFVLKEWFNNIPQFFFVQNWNIEKCFPRDRLVVRMKNATWPVMDFNSMSKIL